MNLQALAKYQSEKDFAAKATQELIKDIKVIFSEKISQSLENIGA
jgi:hypothetical protein